MSVSTSHEVLGCETKAIDPLILMRVIATGGSNREPQGNRGSGHLGVDDGFGNRKMRGDVVVISVNPSTVV